MSKLFNIFCLINFIRILNACDIECPRFFLLDEVDCKCIPPLFGEICPDLYCPPTAKKDIINCECIYPMDLEETPEIKCSKKCSFPQILNPITCECICPKKVNCMPNQIFNSTICQCQDLNIVEHIPEIACSLYCLRPRSYPNFETCKCECPPEISCPPYQILNEETCQCESLSITAELPQCLLLCIGNWTLNKELCKCECINLSCHISQIADLETCECKNRQFINYPLPCIKRCPLGQYLDKDECECKSFNIRPNLSLCNKTCRQGFILIRRICQCVPSGIRPR